MFKIFHWCTISTHISWHERSQREQSNGDSANNNC